jgi:hypothetical protein
VKVTPDNVSTVLLTEADGFNGYTAAAFGRLGDRKVLFVTSGAFPFIPPPYNDGQPPSLIAYGNDTSDWPSRLETASLAIQETRPAEKRRRLGYCLARSVFSI